jgi:site-specific DNA-methyltransferase (adenine-specific)
MLDRNKTYHGDCLELMKDIDTKSVDMILCDLPYGTTACKWDVIIPFEPLWEQYKRIIKDNGAIVLTASQPFTSALVMSNVKMFKYCWYWKKEKGVGFTFAKYRPLGQIEDVLVFGKGKTKYNPLMVKLEKSYRHILPRTQTETLNSGIKTCINGNDVYREYTHKYPTNVLEYSRDSTKRNNKFKHPTQKPVALFEYLIKTYTNEKDLVLDSCAGSGTTGIACMNTGRDYILMEKDETYYQLILDRINSHNIIGGIHA